MSHNEGEIHVELILRAPLPKDKALGNNSPQVRGDVQK